MLGALAIRLAALGVVFCKMGLLIVGLAGTVGGGLLDCLSGSFVVIKEGLSDGDGEGDRLDADEGDVILVTVALDSLGFNGAGAAAGEDNEEDEDDSEGSLLEIVVAAEEEGV